MALSASGDSNDVDTKSDRAATARGRRAGVKGTKPAETSTAYRHGYRIGTEARSKPTRMGRPRKPTSAVALDPRDFEDLAMTYAKGRAWLVRPKFRGRGSRGQEDWEDMLIEFRLEAHKALEDACRCYVGGAPPEAYLLTVLPMKLKSIFPEICSRYLFRASTDSLDDPITFRRVQEQEERRAFEEESAAMFEFGDA